MVSPVNAVRHLAWPVVLCCVGIPRSLVTSWESGGQGTVQQGGKPRASEKNSRAS